MAENAIIYRNCRSVLNKTNELAFILNKFSPLILCLTETWLEIHYPNTALPLQDYQIYKKDRATRGGGVLLAVKNDISSRAVLLSAGDLEIIGADVIYDKSSHIRIICAYLPPQSSPELASDLFATISANIDIFAPYIVLGDFNLPDVNWIDSVFPAGHLYTNLEKFYIQHQPMHQLINFPTRDKNILDLAFTNDEKLFISVESLPNLGASHHSVVKLSIRIPTMMKAQCIIKNFRKADFVSIKREIL